MFGDVFPTGAAGEAEGDRRSPEGYAEGLRDVQEGVGRDGETGPLVSVLQRHLGVVEGDTFLKMTRLQ